MRINPKFFNADFAQPKRDRALMVADAGKLIPRIFDDFGKARAHGPLIARSEAPWENALTLAGRRVGGVSGLLDSHKITEEKIATALSREWPINDFFAHNHFNHALRGFLTGGGERTFFDGLIRCSQPEVHQTFCKLSGISNDDFFKQTSFSYWQLLGGLNCTVVADDVILGRYHIMINGAVKGYCLVDAPNRKIVHQTPSTENFSWGDLLNQFPITSWYEGVRNLSFFDPHHCPIVECQLVDGAIYFLQYHLGRDFVGRNFDLTREIKEGEFEAAFTRGTTDAAGLEIAVMAHQPNDIDTFNPQETASLGWIEGPIETVYQELAWRFMLAGLFQNSHITRDPVAFHHDLLDLTDGHVSRSQLFKPQLGLIGDFLRAVPQADMAKMRSALSGNNTLLPLRFHVTADGERAIFKYLGLGG